MNKMENLQQKALNVIKLTFCIWLNLIPLKTFAQVELNKAHQILNQLFKNSEDFSLLQKIDQDNSWIHSISDSVFVNSLIKGPCLINNLPIFFKNIGPETSSSEQKFVKKVEWDKLKIESNKIKIIKKPNKKSQYYQVSLPYRFNNWIFIRKKYFINNEMVSDAINLYELEEGNWRLKCELFLLLSFPDYKMKS